MKKLSETLTELGIDFTFPIEIEDDNGNETYYEDSDGYSERFERDDNGYATYFENSYGYWRRRELDANGIATYYESSSGYKRGTPKSTNQ